MTASALGNSSSSICACTVTPFIEVTCGDGQAIATLQSGAFTRPSMYEATNESTSLNPSSVTTAIFGMLRAYDQTAADTVDLDMQQPTPPPLHLAQYNIARLNHPVGHPDTQGFVDLIDETNALAQASPGFVWRHGIDTRDTDDAPYDDKLITVNASIWESVEHLRDFAYKGFHRDVFRRRKEWMNESAAVMWWLPAGITPTLQACMARLAFHDRYGSSPYAFQIGQQYPVMAIEADSDDGLRMWLDGRIAGHAGMLQRHDVALQRRSREIAVAADGAQRH